MMLARGTVLVATSAAVRNVVSYGVAAGIPRPIAEKAESAIDAHVFGFKEAHRAGVHLAMGTDSGVPFTRHGNNLDELLYLVEMGLSPQEAIQVATLDSARLLNLHHRIGSLEEGKSADLVIVDGNPMVDIAVLRASDKSAVSSSMERQFLTVTRADCLLVRDFQIPNERVLDFFLFLRYD